MELSEIDPQIIRHLKYLSFKADCMREQQENPITLDVEACKAGLEKLEAEKLEMTEKLANSMPKIPVMGKKSKPKVMQKADGSMSSNAKKWYAFLLEQGLPRDTEGEVSYVTKWITPNPSSPIQIKSWLGTLGWRPRTFKFTKNKLTGEEKRIPQVNKDGLLCESVVDLAEKDPAIYSLEGLSVLSHRITILKGYLKDSEKNEGGKLIARCKGLTNTLRLRHQAPIVNIPSVGTKYGELCRSLLVSEEGKVFVGSDVSSLEDSLKQHFIQPYDPEYVEEMNVEGFDPHLNLGIDAGRLTQEEYSKYISGELDGTEDHKRLKKVRKPLKAVNYSCQYLVGAKTLSRNSGMSEREAADLIDIYWKKNWAVKQVAKDQYVKTLKDGSMWLKNPINGMYYSLRNDRDIFSTLVQGSGDYVFCKWMLYCREAGIKVQQNYHDEWLTSCLPEEVPKLEQIAHDAIKKLNETLKLNKEIQVDVQSGENYAAVH